MNNYFKPKRLVVIAMMSAMAAVFMAFEFYMPPAPPFMMFDFSDIPVIMGGFIVGPVATVLIAVIKNLLKMVISGTHTMAVGELANVICAVAYAFPAAFIYKLKKTKKGAVIGLACGVVIAICVSVLQNLYLTFPLYGKMYGMDMNAIVGTVSDVNPMVKDVVTMFVFSIIPFNIIKYTLISVITMIIYKTISRVVKQFMD